MSRFQRRPLARWVGRLLLLFAACELTLRFAGAVAPRLLSRPAATAGAIVCIGDSNTFGLGAPPNRSYPDQLREQLAADGAPRAVVNLGVAGFRSAEALDRLEDSLREATPACVVFLAGVNDRGKDDHLLAPDDAPPASRVHAWLRRSVTLRVAEAALHVLGGDVARAEFGGRERPRFDPKELLVRNFDQEYPAAQAAGVDAIFAWVSQTWHRERPELAQRTWNDFAATPHFPEIVARFKLPLAAYEWELARMNGRPHPPLAVPREGGFAAEFARFTHAIDDLESGRLEAARAAFDALADGSRNARWQAFLRMHAGWTWLLARDFDRAADALTAQIGVIEVCSPFAGLAWDVGGAAVAAWLAKPPAELGKWIAAHAETWKRVHTDDWSPRAREWIVAAELIDCARRRDSKERAKTIERSEEMLGAARGAPLRWLLAHPDATFAEIQAQLPLEPPFASFIGPSRWFVAPTSLDELRRFLELSAVRLDALASRHGFRVVALTYLDYEADECNGCMRELARNHQWPLVDFQALHAESELGRDDKTRYFCPDRGHPNEAGYALMARAVRDELRRLGIFPR